MIWRFTIINNRTNISTEIVEPIGWDNNTSEIKRDMDWHGIMFTSQGETFQFDGKALQILKLEYEMLGVQADMTLVLEEDCGKGFEEFCRGKFMFKDYEFICGDECYVKVPIETNKEIKDLRNRLNQKVNLETTVAFDETTDLVTYTNLPLILNLPSKGIFIKDDALCETEVIENFEGGMQGLYLSTGHNQTYSQITFGMTTKSAEIGGFYLNPLQKIGPNYFGHGMDLISQNNNPLTLSDSTTVNGELPSFPITSFRPLDTSPIVNLFLNSPNYGQLKNPVQLSFSIVGTIDVFNCIMGQTALYLLKLKDRPNLKTNGEDFEDYEIIYRNIIYDPGSGNVIANGIQRGESVSIFANYTDNNFVLNDGDRLYFFISTFEQKNQTHINNINAGDKAFKLTLNQNSFFKITNLSKVKQTSAKVFAINETISRIVETITNGKLRAFSDYFGRKDSQPYSHAIDGCGSMAVLTDGIRIRKQENRIPNKPSLFSLSLQDIYEGLNPIHNIGMGIEKDPNRMGYNRLRVENWKHFYRDEVILKCDNVSKITRKVNESDIFSTFQFGYQKWEAEEYTGLDEFLTKRTYRTTLSQVKNDLVKLSKFIASGYAIEITRRKGENNSRDWRYDKEIFIICTTRNRIYNVKFIAATNQMTFQVDSNGLEFTIANITIAGSLYNNAIRNITSTGISFIPGVGNTILIDFAGGVTVDEECETVSFPIVIAPLGQSVELGNITNPLNIVDPKTLYNYRISPIRNALRWINKVFGSYKRFDSNAKLIFTDGDANYYASGKLIDLGCALEDIELSENQTIDINIITNPSLVKPFLAAERDVFDYPMSSKDYKLIEENPYGLIEYTNECFLQKGWIDNIQYKPEDGKATFTLIPKIN